jgi:hypothetical protein
MTQAYENCADAWLGLASIEVPAQAQNCDDDDGSQSADDCTILE